MALTGLQIFKYLPGGKKEPEANCKKCGFPTCMAFAMKVAKSEVPVDKCEYISEELKTLVQDSRKIQQAEITFGSSENQVKIGGETVMFRHDKTFINKTCISVNLDSSDPAFETKIDKIKSYSVERVGENLKIDAICLTDKDDSFIQKAVQLAKTTIPLIIKSSDIEKIKSILTEIKEFKPLVYCESNNIQEISSIEKEFNVPIVISGDSFNDLIGNSAKALEKGCKNLVLNLKNQKSTELLENMTFIRRAAIEEKFPPLGFPVLSMMADIKAESIIENSIWASALLCKYSNIIILDIFNESLIYSLLTLRQNIYTDPQKPLQIEAKVYPVGEVDENSPVLVTTNFALTYFTVVGEIESSNIPVHVVITPSDGMSVLTAWAASKFTGEIIAKAIKDFGIEQQIKTREIIIPGYVNTMKEEIEDELPNWRVIPGPNEAVELSDFLKNYIKKVM